MKRLIALSLVVLIAGGFAMAGNGSGMGAVKTGLYERVGGEAPGAPGAPGNGDWVGFVVANTDCEGMLWVNVVVKGLAEGTYDVYVKTAGPYSGAILGQIKVNAKGKGQLQVSKEVGLAEEKGETIPVQVVVKTGAGDAIVGAATATEDVPLKHPCE